MPRRTCSVCLRDDVQDINAAHKAGASVRAIAKRFTISPASADRHFHHDDHKKTRKNIGQIAHIDEEIKKLIRAQTRAKKKRDGAGALAIARELRNWFVLRTKAEIATVGDDTGKDAEQVSPAEALTLAKSVIEAQLENPEVRSWLVGLAERIGPAEEARASGKLTDTHE